MKVNIAIIGAGILGVSLAFWLSELYDISIAIIEKENKVAPHTSSRNTGVIHRPFYLNPEKKRVFAKSAKKSYYLWSKLASQYGLPWMQNGTLEVALRDQDLTTIEQYKIWAIENGMDESEIEILSASDVKKVEPQVECLGAIYSKTDTSVDYGEFSRCVFEIASKNNVQLIEGKVENISETNGIEISLGSSQVQCDYAINAAGGSALDIAHMLDIGKEFTDLHFRGEYWVVDEPFSSKISHNIYSVAKYKDFPFLDPHFIVRSNGRREIGPNAVLVSGPEAYKGLSRKKSELLAKIFERPLTPKFNLFTSRKSLSLAWNEWRSSVSKKEMCERVRQFIPTLDVHMLKERGLAGVRTSMIDSKGFVPEAVLLESEISFHIMNYTSPGATGAPAFSAYVVKLLREKGHLDFAKQGERKHDSLWNYEDAISVF
ncbi:MAG: NAD(P)/FAD-dependent oxidoreductase [Nitrososphaerales archaeon]